MGHTDDHPLGILPDRRATAASEYAVMAGALVTVVLVCAQMMYLGISTSIETVAAALSAL